MPNEAFVAIADAAGLTPGRVTVVRHDGRRIALCNVDGDVYAVDDTCSHDDGPLGEGVTDGHAIICPRHGAKFDVRDGSVLQMPACVPIRVYETKVDNGKVWIKA